MRRLVLPCEVIEQALRERRVVIDDAGEGPGVPRVVVVETLFDERRMVVIARTRRRLVPAYVALDRTALSSVSKQSMAAFGRCGALEAGRWHGMADHFGAMV